MLKKNNGKKKSESPGRAPAHQAIWLALSGISKMCLHSGSMWFILVVGTEFWEASLMPSTWSALSSRCNPSQVCFLHSFHGVCSFGITPAVVELFYLGSVRDSEDTPSAFKRAM